VGVVGMMGTGSSARGESGAVRSLDGLPPFAGVMSDISRSSSFVFEVCYPSTLPAWLPSGTRTIADALRRASAGNATSLAKSMIWRAR